MSEQEKQNEQIQPQEYAVRNVHAVISVFNDLLERKLMIPGFTEHNVKSTLNQILDDLNAHEPRGPEQTRLTNRLTELCAMLPLVIRAKEAHERVYMRHESVADYVTTAEILKSAESLIPLRVGGLRHDRSPIEAPDSKLQADFEILLHWIVDAAEKFSTTEGFQYTTTFVAALVSYISAAYTELRIENDDYNDKFLMASKVRYDQFILGQFPVLSTSLSTFKEYVNGVLNGKGIEETDDLNRPYGQEVLSGDDTPETPDVE